MEKEKDSCKAGDVVWVSYRKSPRWPAKITHVYTKEKKVSYVFFPLPPPQMKNAVFKTNPGAVEPFNVNEPLPQNAKSDLVQACRLAREYVLGTGTGEAPAVQAQPELEQKKVEKKKAEPKASQKQIPKKVEQKAVPTRSFQPGDVVIVDTELGMWPALLKSSNEKVAVYALFPRNHQNHEHHQESPIDKIHPFPKEELDSNIDLSDSEDQNPLREALIDVKDYLEPQKQDKQKEKVKPNKAISVEVLVPSGKNAEKRKTKPKPEEDITSTEKEPQVQKEVKSKEKLVKSVSTAPNKKKDNVQVEARRRPSPTENNEDAEPMRKKVKQRDAVNPESEQPGKAVPSGEPVHQTRSKIQPAEKTTEVKATDVKATEVKATKKAVPAKMNNAAGPSVNKKPSLFTLATSEKAKEYMNSIWSETSDEPTVTAHKGWLDAELGLVVDLSNGKLLSATDVDKLIKEVQDWMTKCAKLPKMSTLKEMFYIANFILPELCAYAISQERNCSIDEAKQVYNQGRASNNGQLLANTEKKIQNGATNPLEHLVLAAERMNGGSASSAS